jgi:hypothetical protein
VAVRQLQVAAVLDAGPDHDAEELAQLTHRLQTDLLELDVDAVEAASGGAPPDGAKGVELLAVGGLVVRFARNATVLRSVVDATIAWVRRQSVRSVKLSLDGDTLELTGASKEEQRQLIELWVARHADAG